MEILHVKYGVAPYCKNSCATSTVYSAGVPVQVRTHIGLQCITNGIPKTELTSAPGQGYISTHATHKYRTTLTNCI